MAVTITENRTTLSDADATTGWTGTNTLTAGNTSPTPVEAANRIDITVSNATQDAFFGITADDFTGFVVYAWFSHRAEFDTTANGGVAIQLGDGTNRRWYAIMGSDAVAFAHFVGPVVWQCLTLDVDNKAAYTNGAITGASQPNVAAITAVGQRWKTIVKAVGGAVNVFFDILRVLDTSLNNGCAITITGGTSGDPGKWTQIAAEDRVTTADRAHGIVRELGTGLFGVQGPIRFGNSTGSATSYFADTNASVSFEDRKILNKYRIYLVDNNVSSQTTFLLGTKVGSGATATGKDGCSIIVPAGIGGLFDAFTSTNDGCTVLGIYGSILSGFTQGVKLRGGHEVIDTTITGCGAVETDGATMVQSSVLDSTVAADASSLIWNENADPDGFLDGMTFSKGANAHHAIEFGTTSPTDLTLRGIDFSGFNASNAQNDSTFHVKRTTGTVTINLVGCTGNATYKSDGATVVLVIDPVTLTITAQDSLTSAVVQGAHAVVLAGTDFVGGTAVTISRSGSTATVAHTGHGFATGNRVRIRGANEPEYNGFPTITVTGTDEYTYTVSGTPATPATGTIVATLLIIEALTDVNGQVSDTRSWPSPRTFVGRVRRGSTAPTYKAQPVSGTIDNVTGASVTAPLASDA